MRGDQFYLQTKRRDIDKGIKCLRKRERERENESEMERERKRMEDFDV